MQLSTIHIDDDAQRELHALIERLEAHGFSREEAEDVLTWLDLLFAKRADSGKEQPLQEAIKAEVMRRSEELGLGIECKESGGSLIFHRPGEGDLFIGQQHCDSVNVAGEPGPTQAKMEKLPAGERHAGHLVISSRNPKQNTGVDPYGGLAQLLALLTNPNVKAAQCLIITPREETLSEQSPWGINDLRADDLRDIVKNYKRIVVVNPDGEREEPGHSMCTETAEAAVGRVELPLEKREAIKPGHQIMRIRISGLPGGHSGLAKHYHQPERNGGDAIAMLSHAVIPLLEATTEDLQLLSISGGTPAADNRIPQEAWIEVAGPPDQLTEFEDALRSAFLIPLREGRSDERALRRGTHLPQDLAKQLTIDIDRRTPTSDDKALSDTSTDAVFGMLKKLPNGAIAPHADGGTGDSCNIGSVVQDGERITMRIMPRAADTARMQETLQKIDDVARANGASFVKEFGGPRFATDIESSDFFQAFRRRVQTLSGSADLPPSQRSQGTAETGVLVKVLGDAVAPDTQIETGMYDLFLQGAHEAHERMGVPEWLETAAALTLNLRNEMGKVLEEPDHE